MAIHLASRHHHRRPNTSLVSIMVLLALATTGCSTARSRSGTSAARNGLEAVEHFVVIYLENRSFDNVWGLWPGVDGLAADPAATPKQTQVDAHGQPYACLPQTDPNLVAVQDRARAGQCEFPNRPFPVDDFITPDMKTCPSLDQKNASSGIKHPLGSPGGCTRDLLHRFYQQQLQIDGGRMDRFTMVSNAAGLTQGYYDTRKLPLYRYLIQDEGAPPYVILDRFFHSAFGGSFLNHFWLISGRTPVWSNAPDEQHGIVGRDGAVTKDGILTHAIDRANGECRAAADGSRPPAATACGDYAVNTVQPALEPFDPEASEKPRLPAFDDSHPTIGDALTDAKIDWAWYAGGWDNATGKIDGRGWTNGAGPTCGDPRAMPKASYRRCPDVLFQFHHQPFSYFARFGPGTPGRAHLRDEADFLAELQAGRSPAVAFVKPLGAENEHPGYTDLLSGNRHLVELVKAIQAGPDWPTTAIIITYDENGGAWDHVPPPTGAGVADVWGPGTRVPAMIISPLLPEPRAVDHTSYDTTSILTTLERRFGLRGRLSPRRDVPDLGNAFRRGPAPKE